MPRYDRQQRDCHEYVPIEGRLSDIVQVLIDMQNRDDIKDHDPSVTWDVNYDYGDVESVDIELKWSRPETDGEYAERVERERVAAAKNELTEKQARRRKLVELHRLADDLGVKVIVR